VVVGFKASPKGCIWEPWGGELTKNHLWQVAEYDQWNPYHEGSYTADPIFNYNVNNYSATIEIWNVWGAHTTYPAVTRSKTDIPYAGINVDNCKFVIDVAEITGTPLFCDVIFALYKGSVGNRNIRFYIGYGASNRINVGVNEFVVAESWPAYAGYDIEGIGLLFNTNSPFSFSCNYINLVKI